MNKVRTEIYLDLWQKNQLKVWAKLKSKSVAVLIREAIDKYLQEIGNEKK